MKLRTILAEEGLQRQAERIQDKDWRDLGIALERASRETGRKFVFQKARSGILKGTALVRDRDSGTPIEDIHKLFRILALAGFYGRNSFDQELRNLGGLLEDPFTFHVVGKSPNKLASGPIEISDFPETSKADALVLKARPGTQITLNGKAVGVAVKGGYATREGSVIAYFKIVPYSGVHERTEFTPESLRIMAKL